MNDHASLPYAGTSGWAGSEASEQRALRRDSSELTSRTQRDVFRLVASNGFAGITIAELRDRLPLLHHGTLSGTLSVLHKDGRIARLQDRRGACHIYVQPEFVVGRETSTQGRARSPKRTKRVGTETLEAAIRYAYRAGERFADSEMLPLVVDGTESDIESEDQAVASALLLISDSDSE